MAKEDLQEHLPYQQASLIRQTLAERGEAEALGQTTRVEACDKVLKGLGWKAPEKTPKVSRESAPEGREARHERVQKAEGAGEVASAGVRRGPVQHKA